MTKNVLDDGEGLTVRCVLDDREVERGRRRGTGDRKSEFSLFVLLGLMYYRLFKNQNFFILNNTDVENCGSFKSFGFIYIYRLKEKKKKTHTHTHTI